MVVKAHSAPEVTIAFGTVYPVPLFTLGLETKVARTLASVIFSVVVAFETFYAEITSVEEGWHASNDVIVVIVMIQINLSGSLGSPVNDGIGVVPRTHYELIVRKYILKLFNLVSSVLCQRYPGLLMQFFSELCCILQPLGIASHFSCLSTLALAITIARAQQSSSLLTI